MKTLISVLLLTAMIAGLSACTSSPTEQPGGVSSTASPASSNSAAPELPPAAAPKPEPAPAKMISIPAGTALEVVLNSSLGSATSKPGDTFTASLAEPLVIGDATALKKGATVHGRVVDVKESGRVKGLASLSLALTSVVQDGTTTEIVTRDFVQEAQSTKKKDAAIIGGAAAVGTAIGAIAGGGKGAATGAAVGGGAGAGTVLATKGKEVVLGPESRLKFTIAKSFGVRETERKGTVN